MDTNYGLLRYKILLNFYISNRNSNTKPNQIDSAVNIFSKSIQQKIWTGKIICRKFIVH